MRRRAEVGRRTAIGGLISVPLLAACEAENSPDGGAHGTSDGGASDGGGAPGGSDASDAGGADAAGAPAAPAVQVSFGPVEMTVEVASVVRSGAHLVLTLEVTADDPDGVFPSSPAAALEQLLTTDYSGSRPFDGLRVLDLDGDRAAAIAMDADGRSIQSEPFPRWSERSGSTGMQSIQLVYGDLGTDQVAVLIPKGGLLSAVPVLDGEVPEVGAEEPLELGAVAAAPVSPLISYSRDLTSTTRTQSTEESTTVSLGSDILFDSSSAELNGEARTIIEEAGHSLAEHRPGPVQVIGHTDSIDDDAFNQTLSEQRAQAVADVLGTVIDGAEYPLETSGQGESSPIADNGSDEGRALNRRVELTIDTPVLTEEHTVKELPEFDGQVATGAEGVRLQEEGATPRTVRATGARVVQGHLVVRVEFTREDDAVDSAIGLSPSVGRAAAWVPDDIELLKTEGGIAVMDGPVATLPALHSMGGDAPIRPLTDLRTNSRLDGGVTRVSDLVYPAGLAITDTVTIQLVEDIWRLTDIPVTR